MPQVNLPDVPQPGSDRNAWTRWGVTLLVVIASALLSQFMTQLELRAVKDEVKEEVKQEVKAQLSHKE